MRSNQMNIFPFFNENKYRGYSLEVPQWAQHKIMFSWRNKKNINIFWLKQASYLELQCVWPLTSITLSMLGNFACFFVICGFFFSKWAFSKNSFRNTIRVSTKSDLDQARCFVGPDLGPNCLQRLSADDKSHRQRGKRSLYCVTLALKTLPYIKSKSPNQLTNLCSQVLFCLLIYFTVFIDFVCRHQRPRSACVNIQAYLDFIDCICNKGTFLML